MDFLFPLVGLLMGAAVGALVTFMVMRRKAGSAQQGYAPPPPGYAPQQQMPQGYSPQPGMTSLQPSQQGYPQQ